MSLREIAMAHAKCGQFHWFDEEMGTGMPAPGARRVVCKSPEDENIEIVDQYLYYVYDAPLWEYERTGRYCKDPQVIAARKEDVTRVTKSPDITGHPYTTQIIYGALPDHSKRVSRNVKEKSRGSPIS